MKYHLEIQTYSPVHIGSGDQLIRNFDYVPFQGNTYVLDQDAIFRQEYHEKGRAAVLDTPAGAIYPPEYWQSHPELCRYTLKGGATKEMVIEQIKDVFHGAYIPGSSLKGAIRTAILAYLYDTKAIPHESLPFGRSLEQAAFQPEQQTGPNFDLLRALQVSDCLPVGGAQKPMLLATAQVFSARTNGSPVELEALAKDVKLKGDLVVDELALQYEKELGWQERTPLLFNLPFLLQRFSERKIEVELENAQKCGFTQTVEFYAKIKKIAEQIHGKPGALLQIGWGNGWYGTTLGAFLDEETKWAVRKKNNLGKPPRIPRGNWTPNRNSPFPASRRLLARPQPGEPFGWIVILMEERKMQYDVAFQDSRERWRKAMPIPVQNKPAPAVVLQPSPQKPAVTNAPPQPQSPAPNRPPVKPPKTIIKSFSSPPLVGDVFTGAFLDFTGDGGLWIEPPGLDEEKYCAYAAPAQNPLGKRLRDGDSVLAEVLSVKPDPKNRGGFILLCQVIRKM